jgi:hypothetical protein
VQRIGHLKTANLAGITTIIILAVSALLFDVYGLIYSTLVVTSILVVVIVINVRNWKKQ